MHLTGGLCDYVAFASMSFYFANSSWTPCVAMTRLMHIHRSVHVKMHTQYPQLPRHRQSNMAAENGSGFLRWLTSISVPKSKKMKLELFYCVSVDVFRLRSVALNLYGANSHTHISNLPSEIYSWYTLITKDSMKTITNMPIK